MWCNWESSMKASLMHSPYSHFRVCCTSTFSQYQPLLATFFDYSSIINGKNTCFVFRHTLSHFEKSCFRMYLLFILTNFEYHPTKFQIIYKTTLFEKSTIHHCNLDVVKKRSKFLYSVSFENTEGGPLFYAPVKLQDYYQYANK